MQVSSWLLDLICPKELEKNDGIGNTPKDTPQNCAEHALSLYQICYNSIQRIVWAALEEEGGEQVEQEEQKVQQQSQKSFRIIYAW